MKKVLIAALRATIGVATNAQSSVTLYGWIATVRNSMTANFGLGPNSACPGGLSDAANDNPLPGHSKTGVYAGIQHSF
jgi:hypothetical protein